MTVTNAHSGTHVVEIERGIWRISTPIGPDAIPGGFTMNQFLVVDDEPLLFHTGPRTMLPLVREAIEHVMPLARLRWISYSHAECDESGALDELLALAPDARPLSGRIGGMIAFDGCARAPRVVDDGEAFSIGSRELVWLDTPHVPHGWDAGMLFDATTRTLFCSDIFTQAGAEHPPVTDADVFAASEPVRAAMGYMPRSLETTRQLERLAAREPALLACMHGSSFRGDAPAILRELAGAIANEVRV
jgi:flavorubredoxin